MKFTEVTDVKFLPYYNKKITIVNSEEKPLRFQVPRMYMPFGVSGFVGSSGPTKWNIDFSMRGYDEEGNYVKKFYDFLRELESSVIKEVHNQSPSIFGYDKPIEELEKIFNSNIKVDKFGVWEPKFRVKIDNTTSIFDTDNNDLEDELVDGLYSRSQATCILEVAGVYFMQKMFGITWKIYQMRVRRDEPQEEQGFMFRDV